MHGVGETFFARDRAAWRAWLEVHHATRSEIWLVLYKKRVSAVCVSLEEAVQEALCFGWIDGKLRRIDDEKHALRFSPRRPGSVWAASNRRRVEELMRQGRVTPAGMALVEAAKASGEWEQAVRREDVDTLPADLERALADDPDAQAGFHALTRSQRGAFLFWVNDAKGAETRARRIVEVVKRARQRRPLGT